MRGQIIAYISIACFSFSSIHTGSGGLLSSNAAKVFALLDSTAEKFHKIVRG